jgi:hypothetical protein
MSGARLDRDVRIPYWRLILAPDLKIFGMEGAG